MNTKNQKNGEIYKAILQELKHRASKRGENVNFTVDQLRTKFKRCISLCKKAALTIKTSTGIKRFQGEKELGQWFDQLYPIVKARDSCNPESAVEPSSSDGGDRSMHDTTTSPGDDDEINTGPGTKMFVPIKSGNKKVKKKEDVCSTTREVLNLVKDVIENDPTKDLIELMRSEMEQSRKQEMSILQVLLNSSSNVGPSPSPYMYHDTWERHVPFGSDPSMNVQDFNNTWPGGFVSSTAQSRNMGISSRSASPSQGFPHHSHSSSPTPSVVRDDCLPTYQTL